MRGLWDRVGISASLLCVAHCLLTPLLVLALPFAGDFLSHDWFHVGIALVVFPVAAWALWNGYRLHRRKSVIYLGTIGLFIIALGMFIGAYSHEFEVAAMVSAGLILAAAHYQNLRACRAH
ncbi:MAG TPA: MerC domain-containing protein [Bdellovibrionales bacterium]|nr:MerC domain-containing protein [Bdellovibrionales bacterium]